VEKLLRLILPQLFPGSLIHQGNTENEKFHLERQKEEKKPLTLISYFVGPTVG
jgi:hypothetical protein